MTTTTQTTTNEATQVRKDVIGVLDGQAAGAMIWWELSGNVDRDTLALAWKAAGLDEKFVPDTISSREALKRALEELRSVPLEAWRKDAESIDDGATRERRLLVRPLEGARGYSLVEEKAAGEKLKYDQELTVTCGEGASLLFDPTIHPWCPEVATKHYRQQLTLNPSDISGMLLRFCDSLLSVPLRSRGGFYFLPPAAVEKFRLAAQVLRLVSGHVCYEIPAMRSKEAVEAILAAVQHEAEAEAAAMVEILDAGEVGARGLRGQANRCARVEAKLASYEDLLGAKLTALTDNLKSIRARLTEAALVASTDDKDA